MAETESEADSADRREFDRIPARIEIRLDRESDAAKALRAYSLNFSVGGLCIRTRHPYSVGTELEMSMTVGGEDFRLKVVVAWVRGDAAGLRFQEVTEEDRERLELIAATLRKRAAAQPKPELET